MSEKIKDYIDLQWESLTERDRQILNYAIGKIEQLKIKNREFEAELLLYRWIPVSERLPECPKYWGKKIWVIIKDEPFCVPYYGRRIGMTHWQLITLPKI